MQSSNLAAEKGSDIQPANAFAQHFIDNLHRKLHDVSLLQTYPQPTPQIFKHNGRNATSPVRSFLAEAAANPTDVFGSERNPLCAPPGSFKLLSSDYAWLDAPRAPARREPKGTATTGAIRPDTGPGADPPGEQLPEPPVAMQQTRFLGHARLVLIKLRQQLEELCVGAVRTMEAAAMPTHLGDGAPGELRAATLASLTSYGGSKSAAAASWVSNSLGHVTSGGGGLDGGGRLPPGLADELADAIRTKLNAAFEDCLTDLMDQLWGVLQYAGTKHALVDRLAEAMKEREAELEATAARYREEAASKLRALRRQKEEIEAAAEKERTELKALVAASNSRVDFLERELNGVRAALDAEKAQVGAKLDAQRAEYEAILAAKDEAAEALRADSVARLEELRVANAALQQELTKRREEVAQLASRATDQSDILALALARRDGTSKELELMAAQLDDYKRLTQLVAKQSLPGWLNTLREGDTPLMPLSGGPLSMEYGAGRALLATARAEGLRAVQEELRRLLPEELPQPEDGWPPEEDGEGGPNGRGRSPSPVDNGRNPFPPTLPATWLRFVRAPLGHVMNAGQLMSHLADLARAKWEADREARLQGQPPPDLHMFVYKHALNEHSSALDTDDAVTCLVQSLRAHSQRLPRAALWMQLLQLGTPVLPLDACGYYLEVFHALVAPPHSHAGGSKSSQTPANVADKAACVVWVPPARWKPIFTGPASAVFDAERKMALLKQAATVRVDTVRTSKSYGMSDGDALMSLVMATWLRQRQTAVSDLSAAWTALEPVAGAGVLGLNINVNELAKVAASALGHDAIPQDRASLIDLYFSTVLEARRAQAASRMRWSGLNVAALAAALSAAELLPPRPISRRGSPSAARLAVAAGHVLRLAASALEAMRAVPAFRATPAFESLEGAVGRLQELTALCGKDASVREQAEHEKRLQAGWTALEEVVDGLLAAQEAFQSYEEGQREADVRAAVDAAVAQQRWHSEGDKGSESRRSAGTPRLSSVRSRNSRVQRTSNFGASGEAGEVAAAAAGPGGSPLIAALTSPLSSTPNTQSLSGGGIASALAAMSGRISARFAAGAVGSSRPGSDRRSVSGRPPSGAWPRDLRAALASGRWSSDDEEETLSLDDPSPPTIQLRGRPSRKQLHSAMSAAVASTTEPGAEGGDGSTDYGGTPVSSNAATTRFDPDDPPLYLDSPAEARLAQMEEKYGRLRSRFGETMRALNAAYSNAAGDAGAGLPAPEVMAQLGPAAKLHLVAELLAELHQEVEQGVWPHLDTTIMAAISRQASVMTAGGGGGGPGSASGTSRAGSSRPTSALPAMRMTVRPLSAFATPRQGYAAAVGNGGGSGNRREALGADAAGRIGPEGSSTSWAAGNLSGRSAPGELQAAAAAAAAAAAEDGLGLPPLSEVQEMAGRLHAHAGHVGQVMATAALETAALAAALDDLASWRSFGSSLVGNSPHHSQQQQQQRRSTAASVVSGLPAGERVSGSSWAGAGGADGFWHTPNSTIGGSVAGGDAFPSPSSVGLVSFPATDVMQRSYKTPRGAGLVPPLPLANLFSPSGSLGGRYSTTFSASGASSMGPGAAPGSGSGGGEGVSVGEAAAGADAAVCGAAAAEPWEEEMPYDSDPRDTAYLDALRALHLVAEAQASGEGDVGAVAMAVREVVQLLGGQPQVTEEGKVIEFFPRRIPKDWRHPVLRSSLVRLYIFICGALLQQHERSEILKEASADVDQRLASLAQAADELEGKAAALRGLQTSLGLQLAALASCVTRGSVLTSCVTRLETLGDNFRMRVVGAQQEEAFRLPVPMGGLPPPGPLTPPGAGKAAAPVLPQSKPRPGPSRLSGGGEIAATSAPANRVVIFSIEEWQVVQDMVGGLMSAVEQLKATTEQLALLTKLGVKGEEGLPGGSVPDQLPLSLPALPSGDRILQVHVHVAPATGTEPPAATPRGDRLPTTGSGPLYAEPTAAAGLFTTPSAPAAPADPAASAVEGPLKPITFVVSLGPQPDVLDGIAGTAPGAQPANGSGGGAGDVGNGASQVSGEPPAPAPVAAAGLPQYPDAGTPAVTPEVSCSALNRRPVEAGPHYSLHVALRQVGSGNTNAAIGNADPSALPPGEALIQLSDSLLRRSAMAAMRRHMGSTGGARLGSSRPGQREPALDAQGNVPAHYERRPMTARAYVEGVMIQAREEQLERLYGAAGPMPRGGLPEVEGLAQMDGHEAALMDQRALVLAGTEPEPTTALEALVQLNKEQATAASVAATTAVAEAVSAAAAAASSAAGTKGRKSPVRGREEGQQQPNSARSAGTGSVGRAAASPRLSVRDRTQSQMRRAGTGTIVHSRLSTGVTGTRMSTLPAVNLGPASDGNAAGEAWPSGAHLGYYPGLQVDAAGHLKDWRLPVLASTPAPVSAQRAAAKADGGRIA